MTSKIESLEKYLKDTEILADKYLRYLEAKDLPKFDKRYIDVATSHNVLNEYFRYINELIDDIKKENEPKYNYEIKVTQWTGGHDMWIPVADNYLDDMIEESNFVDIDDMIYKEIIRKIESEVKDA